MLRHCSVHLAADLYSKYKKHVINPDFGQCDVPLRKYSLTHWQLTATVVIDFVLSLDGPVSLSPQPSLFPTVLLC